MPHVQLGKRYTEGHKVFGSPWCTSGWASHEQQQPRSVAAKCQMQVWQAIFSKFYRKFYILQQYSGHTEQGKDQFYVCDWSHLQGGHRRQCEIY